MPGYFASKARATRSDTGRSIAAYQTTLPSFFAASIKAPVTAVGSGAAARTRVAANALATAAALRTPLRVSGSLCITRSLGRSPAHTLKICA